MEQIFKIFTQWWFYWKYQEIFWNSCYKNKEIPIITDQYVDPEFGTGCLKVTPAHSENDKIIGDKHKLEIVDILNDDGTLNEFALHYNGKDRFLVRIEILEELRQLGVYIDINIDKAIKMYK